MDYVYWIKNDSCTSIETDGYVGVSAYPSRRFKVHLSRNNKIPKDATIEIIFQGNRKDCFALEEKLRPIKGIGWNNAVGGKHGYKKGFTHSPQTKKKMKDAWTPDRREIASKVRAEMNVALFSGQKRPDHSKAMLGKNNPMYGKTHSEQTRQKISETGKNKTPPNKQHLYCVFCRKPSPLSVLKKYHGPGRKNCI